MKARTVNIIKYLLSALLAAILLYFTFRGVNWAEFVSVLKECRWGFVLLSMLAGVLSMLLRALRWRLLLLPIDADASRLKCIDGINIAKLADFVFPHLGELVRCGYVTARKLPYDKALGTVVLERAWDMFVLALLCVSVLVLKWSDFGNFVSENMIAPAIGGMQFSLWWVVAGVVLLLALVVAFLPPARRFVRGIWQGIVSCLRMKRKGAFLLYTLAMWAMYLLMSLFIIHSLPFDSGLGLTDALFIMLVGSVAGVVPVPGGFGAFHYMVALALDTVYGIPFATGIIFATLSHESQAVTMAICGIVSYIIETVSKNASPHSGADAGNALPD